MTRRLSTAAAALAAAVAVGPSGLAHGGAAAGGYTVVGDAIPSPLGGAKGDAARGRSIIVNRHVGLCLLCHNGPFPEERFQGTIGPDLKGTAGRLSEGQIRLRIIDPSRVNAETIMPAYFRTEGLTRVAPAFRGKTVLTAGEIEDVIAFLATLRD